MSIGESRILRINDYRSVEVARTQAAMASKLFNCRFSVNADYANNLLTVTKLPK